MQYHKVIAFFKKDYRIETGYKMAFAIQLLSAFFPILSFFFISKIVDGNAIGLKRYGSDYFSFALIGIAFTGYFTLAVGTFSSTMRRSQMAGCLEAILSSQTSTTEVVLMSSLYSFVSAAIHLLLTLSVAAIFLNFNLSHINVLSTAIVLVLSLVIFISLGIISAAGTIIFKQGEPFGWVFGGLSSLLGGALFPVSVMPVFLQYVSKIIPIAYSLEALRLAILKGYTLTMLLPQLVLLFTIGLMLFPLSLAFFRWAIVKGKKDGTLMHY
jgi:ABC-2 type transport system permease protein